MKKILILLTLVLFMAACSSDSPTGSPYIDLPVTDGVVTSTSARKTGEIETTGDIDRYKMTLNDYNRDVQIKCTSETMRPDVDLLVNVYEMNSDGELIMVAGNHAPEDGMFPADIKINLFIDQPKELYVFVRDLLDDDASTNPYYISAAYQAAPDGNESVATATALSIDGEGVRDAIGTVGDIDNFSFTVAQAGVYDIEVLFEAFAGTGVRLSASLYDQLDMLTPVESRDLGDSTESHIRHYLEAGSYVLAIKDNGMDDFDNSSIFTVSVSSTDVAADNNDTPADVEGDTYTFPVTGSIEYSTDLDWYNVGSPGGAGDVHVLDVQFSSLTSFQYQLNLYQIDDTAAFDYDTAIPVFSHNYRGDPGADTPMTYTALVKLDPSETYYMLVQPVNSADVAAGYPYTLTMDLTSVTDADEAGDGNNNNSDAVTLNENTDYNDKKISYRGDVDFYEITIPAGANQILSVYLDIPASPEVEYAMDISRFESNNYSLVKRAANGSEERRTVDLKASFIVQGGEIYHVKVYDFQTDDSEDTNYSIRWDAEPIPGAPAACPKDGAATEYNSEIAEQANTGSAYDKVVNIEYPTGDTAQFRANTSLMLTSAPSAGDPKTIVFPWISGYMDYQGDEDWYSINLAEDLPGEADESWYYTISVELYADSSSVEYTWEYMPDSDNNGNVNTRWCSGGTRYCNGIQASECDTTPETNDLFNSVMTANAAGTEGVWLGSGTDWSDWRGPVLFRISDFNYMNLPDGGGAYLSPDDDWGYDAPYYFRVTLTYYPGAAHPPE